MILDVTCGTRGIWFDKEFENTIFLDRRQLRTYRSDNRKVFVEPNIVADNRFLPFQDNVFEMVVYDPPHLFKSKNFNKNFCMELVYSSLNRDTWVKDLYRSFREILRVLKLKGFMVFKWCESSIKISRIFNLMPRELKKLFGTKGNQKTKWVILQKVD